MKLTNSSLFFILLFLLYTNCKQADKKQSITNLNIKFQNYFEKAEDKDTEPQLRLIFIDSALQQTEFKSKDSLYRKGLLKKISILSQLSNFEEAILLADSTYVIATRENDLQIAAEALFLKGLSLQKNYQYFQAFKAYNASLNIFQELGNTKRIGGIALNKAVLQKDLGDFKGSEATSVEALELGKTQLKTSTRIGLYNNLASTSKELGDYNDALYWNDKAINISESPRLDLILKGNRYNIYLSAGNYTEAYRNLEIFLKDSLLNLSKNRKNYLRELDHYGEALSHLNNPKAELILKEALAGRIEIEDSNGEIYSRLHLADHYVRNNQTNDALYEAELSLDLAKKLKSADAILEILPYTIQLKNNPKEEAVDYQRISDSMQKIQLEAREQFAKIRYDSEKNREENLKLRAETAEQELEIAQSNNQVLLLGGIAGILVVSGILLFRILRERHKRQTQLASYNTERHISKRVHDELANDVYQLMTKIQTDTSLSMTSQNNYLDDLESVYQRSRDISRETSSINTNQFSEELKGLLNIFKNEEQNVITKDLNLIQWSQVSDYKKITIYRVLQELMTNFKKHSEATICTLVFSEINHNIIITYTDNGIGIIENRLSTRNGLQNAENRMETINGSLTFETTTRNSLKIKLTVPK